MVFVLPRDAFFDTIEIHPELKSRVHRCAMKMATMRCVLLCRHSKHLVDKASWPTLVEVFSKLGIASPSCPTFRRGATRLVRRLCGSGSMLAGPIDVAETLGDCQGSSNHLAQRLSALEASMAASAASAQIELDNTQRHLDDIRSLRLQPCDRPSVTSDSRSEASQVSV